MKKFLNLLSTITLLILALFVLPEITFAESTNKNDYITQYYKEHGNEPIDAEEEKIILETLESYWQEDSKVGDLLAKKTKDSSIQPLVLSTKAQDKTEAIKIIKNLYDKVNVTEQELLYDYIERHYKGIDDLEVQNFFDSLNTKRSENQFSTFAAYNGNGAGTWAYNNYNKYSTNYPKFTGSFGTNCTNFISQAMHIGGGLPKQGDWTITRKNTKYHVINSADQLNYSWKLSDPSPWISVKEFSKFWRSKSSVRGASQAQYLHNTSNYRGQKVGDIVIFSKGVAGVITVPTHAMIITQVTANDYNLAGNSVERRAHPLKTAIDSYSYIEFYRPK